jgi:hypothetical protein
MKQLSIIYEEKKALTVKYYHPKSDDYLNYESIIRIYDSGKYPIEMILNFDGTPPCYAPMPPENHKIRATSILHLYLDTTKWFKKYGYILK